MVPGISKNVAAKFNYPRLESLLMEGTPHPKVLVVGSGDLGQGLAATIGNPSIEFLETDVAFRAETGLIPS